MAKYPKGVKEYCFVRFETCSNNAQISRELKKAFDLDQSVEQIRVHVSRIRRGVYSDTPAKDIKRLFFDIETSPVFGWFWRTGKQYVNHRQVLKDKKIICVSYKWQSDDEVKTLVWEDGCDKKLVKEFIKVLGEADEIVAHNGDRYDIKEVRTRAIQEGVLMFPKYRTFDTLKKARSYFNFHSNKLDYLGEVLKVGRKLDHEGIDLWLKVCDGDKKSLKKMVDYCEQDVILLEDVFHAMSPYVDHNTNHAVQEGGVGHKWKCPNCASEKVKLSHTDTTPMGYIRRFMKCKTCKKQYKISNRTYLTYLTKK